MLCRSIWRHNPGRSCLMRVNCLRQSGALVLLPRRWVVERSFGWATRFRRSVKDYEVYASTLAGAANSFHHPVGTCRIGAGGRCGAARQGVSRACVPSTLRYFPRSRRQWSTRPSSRWPNRAAILFWRTNISDFQRKSDESWFAAQPPRPARGIPVILRTPGIPTAQSAGAFELAQCSVARCSRNNCRGCC